MEGYKWQSWHELIYVQKVSLAAVWKMDQRRARMSTQRQSLLKKRKKKSIVVAQVRAVGIQDQSGNSGGGMKRMGLKRFKLSASKCRVL